MDELVPVEVSVGVHVDVICVFSGVCVDLLTGAAENKTEKEEI